MTTTKTLRSLLLDIGSILLEVHITHKDKKDSTVQFANYKKGYSLTYGSSPLFSLDQIVEKYYIDENMKKETILKVWLYNED